MEGGKSRAFFNTTPIKSGQRLQRVGNNEYVGLLANNNHSYTPSQHREKTRIVIPYVDDNEHELQNLHNTHDKSQHVKPTVRQTANVYTVNDCVTTQNALRPVPTQSDYAGSASSPTKSRESELSADPELSTEHELSAEPITDSFVPNANVGLAWLVTVCFNLPLGILALYMSNRAFQQFKKGERKSSNRFVLASTFISLTGIIITVMTVSTIILMMAIKERAKIAEKIGIHEH